MHQQPTNESLIELIKREMGESPKPGEHVFRSKPGVFRFNLPASMKRKKSDPTDAAPTTRAAGDEETAEGSFVVAGVASSTSVDWYGTEMSLAALEDMKNQFNNGVDLFPRHGGWLDSVDWDEVIGRTFQGILQRDTVVNPADASEPGFILSIEANVDRSAPRAARLEQRLDDDAEIGLSIGGWFLEVRYITDDDGELTRIIVERVLLDHVAVVRNPANPDSDGLKLLHEAGKAVFGRKKEEPETTPATPSEAAPEEPPKEVTQVRSLDSTPLAGDNTDDPGELPDATRSADMPNEKLDQILASLGDIKETQDRNTTRLDALDARDEPTPDPAPAPAPEPVDIEAAIARGVEAALAATRNAPEPAPAPAPEESAEMIEMRAKVARIEADLENRDRAMANLIDTGRVGRSGGMAVPILGGGYDADQATREIDHLVSESRENSGVLCAVVTRHKKSLTVVREISGHLPRGERGKEYLQAAHNAPHILRSLCTAAERDGIIGDLNHGWRR